MVSGSQSKGKSRNEIFVQVWDMTRDAFEESVVDRLNSTVFDHGPAKATIPYLCEPWYC